jgi:hypothetical protein
MGNVRYNPRLKVGVLKNKRVILSGKNITKINKKKWASLLKFNYFRSRILEPLVRNDIEICLEKNIKKQRVFDLRKNFSNVFFLIRQLSSYYRTFKTKPLRQFFLEHFRSSQKLMPIKTLFDFIELRIDVLLLRTNLVSSLFYARWLVSSGFVFINNSVCREISSSTFAGDCLEIKKLFFFKFFFF